MDTRLAILDLGEYLIRTKGYHAFSYKDIADELQIKNAAVHYHFPSKTDLGMAVLERAIERIGFSSRQWEQLPEDQQLKRFLNTYFESNARGTVCLMGALSAASTELPEEMRLKLKEMGDLILAWVSKCLADGKRKGIFEFKEKPATKATMLVSNMLASLLFSRVLGKKHFETIYKQVLASV
ncbi:TetR/AcrR family transcriptional regulator [Polluticoccus soli]|uniref:TetR/AcrR family transcriptional regulator n=1 Tax=Polluticoccus soli TaxID=3034150 RepID=UPI0023E2253D|nr:TetR/AcrR family transcriptional regulator [Flavipsychrobacter sp. JY13-12]